MEKLKTQLEVAAHWLNEAATALLDDDYLRENFHRVREDCLRLAAANDNIELKETA